jgi:hypothetical protein
LKEGGNVPGMEGGRNEFLGIEGGWREFQE